MVQQIKNTKAATEVVESTILSVGGIESVSVVASSLGKLVLSRIK